MANSVNPDKTAYDISDAFFCALRAILCKHQTCYVGGWARMVSDFAEIFRVHP